MRAPAIADARVTLHQLVNAHRQTIRDIDDGKKFWRRGEDCSAEIRKRCEHEIEQCMTVMQALEHMKIGDIKRAADLCAQIQEHMTGGSDERQRGHA